MVTKYILIYVQRVEIKNASFSPASLFLETTAPLSSLKTSATDTKQGLIV